MTIDHQSNRPKSFGKRGSISMPGPAARALPGASAEPPQAAPGGALAGLPKWAIGAVAAAFLMALVSTGGGFGAGGLLGGLLGGFMAGKLMANSSQTPPARPAPAASAAAPAATQTASQSVARGGFGSTGSSFGFRAGG